MRFGCMRFTGMLFCLARLRAPRAYLRPCATIILTIATAGNWVSNLKFFEENNYDHLQFIDRSRNTG